MNLIFYCVFVILCKYYLECRESTTESSTNDKTCLVGDYNKKFQISEVVEKRFAIESPSFEIRVQNIFQCEAELLLYTSESLLAKDKEGCNFCNSIFKKYVVNSENIIKSDEIKFQEQKYSEIFLLIFTGKFCINNITISFRNTIVEIEQDKALLLENYTLGQPYSYYVNITHFNENEDGVVSVYITDPTATKDLKCKIIRCVNDKDEIERMIPKTEKESNCVIEEEDPNKAKNNFFLNFKRISTSKCLENKKVFFAFTIVINSDSPEKAERQMRANLGNRIEKINFNEKEKLQKIQYKLGHFKAKLFELNFTPNKDVTYIIKSGVKDSQTIYLGNLTNFKESSDELIEGNTNRIISDLWVLNSVDHPDVSTLIIKVFDSQVETYLLAEMTNHYINYYSGNKSLNTLIFNMTNMKDSAYLIGSYTKNFTNYLFLEELFGLFDVYYKTEVKFSDKSILPLESNIIDDKNTVVYNQEISNEIFRIQSKSPGIIKLHFLDSKKKGEIKTAPNSFEYIYALESETIDLSISCNDDNFKILFQILLPGSIKLVRVLTLTNEADEREINGTNKKTIFDLCSSKSNIAEENIQILNPTQNISTLATFTLIDSKENYQKITETSQITKNMVLVELNLDNSESGIEISVQSNSEFYYQFLSILDEKEVKQFIPPAINGTDLNQSFRSTFFFLNPFDMYNSANKSYFFSLYFEKSIDGEIVIKKIKKENIENIFEKGGVLKNGEKRKMLNKDKVPKNYFFLFQACNNETKVKASFSYYNHDILSEEFEDFTLIEYNNTISDLILSATISKENEETPTVYLQYTDNLNATLIEVLKDINKTNLTISFNSWTQKVNWTEIPNPNKEFEVNYKVFVRDNKTIFPIKDRCSFIQNITEIDHKNTTKNFLVLDNIPNSNFSVLVVANVSIKDVFVPILYQELEVKIDENDSKVYIYIILLCFGVWGIFTVLYIIKRCKIRKIFAEKEIYNTSLEKLENLNN